MEELLEIAIAAFRAGRYHDAIELFLQITDIDTTNYPAQLYLVMAYQKAGLIAEAHRLLKRLSAECSDDVIQLRTQSLLPVIEAEMRRRFSREPLNKATNKPAKANDADDIVWVG